MSGDTPALSGGAIDYRTVLTDYSGRIDFYDSRGHVKTLGGQEVSHGAVATAGVLAARGLRRADRVVLLTDNTGEYLRTLLAVLLLGAVPCAVAPPPAPTRGDSAGVRHLQAALRVLDPALVISTAAATPALSHNAVLRYEDLMADPAPPVPDLCPARPADIHHIQLTSGSTSAPKAVVLTHANVAHNVAAIGASTTTRRDRDRIFSWLPMYHDMGLIQVLGGLLYGLPIGLMTPLGFLRDPLAWARNMTHHGSTITAGPTFGYGAATAALARAERQETQIDLRRLRHAFVGAEPIAASTLREFTERFAPLGLRADALVPCYGMAESVLATTMAVRPVPNGPGDFGRVRTLADGSGRCLVSCGSPIEGMRIRIVDSHGADADEGAVGDIWIGGPSVMVGYLGPDGAIVQQPGRWHDTGDRGFLRGGELFVSGRSKEMLIVRGRNFPPYDVERLIGTLPLVGPGQTAVFAAPDTGRGREDLVAVVAAGTTDPDRRRGLQRDIAALVRDNFGFALDEVVLVPRGAIARTTSGKIQRLTLRDRYLAGELRSPH